MQRTPWQSWFERLSRGWLPARREPRPRNFARLSVRRLEERRVMDAAAVAPPPVQITEDAGAVVINVGPADGEADVFKVLREEADGKDLLQVTLNGNVVFNKDLDQVASITIHGSSDAESLIVDFGDGGPGLAGGIHFVGGSTGAGDTISLVNGQTHNVSYSFTGPSDGEIQVGSGAETTSIQFSGTAQTILDSLATESRSFTFGGTIAEVGLGPATGTDRATVNVAGGAQVEFVGPTSGLTLRDAASSGVELTVTGYTSTANADLSILGSTQTQLQFVGDTNLAGGALHVEAGSVAIDGTVVTTHAAIEINASESLLVSSTGALSSTGGSIAMTSPDLRMDGAILARDGGQIELDAGASGTLLVTGQIDATSNVGVGGAVDLFGSRVGLLGDAVVDVSGVSGGGTIRIGGDWQGANGQVSNSLRTYVDQHVSLKADALQSGNGGSIVVWSDEYTVFYGSLSARGGAEIGNGGQVEISGARSLVARGSYDLTATHGQQGTILFDPLSILIVGGTADGADHGDSSSSALRNDPGSNTSGSILFGDEGAGAPVPFVIYESEIEGSTANVILEARQSIATTGTFTNADVLLQTNRSLTLRTRNAAGDGAGGIDLTGSADGANLQFRTRGSGTITIAAATAGELTGDVVVGRLQTDNRAIQISTAVGNVTVAGRVQAGAFTATAGNSIAISGPLTVSVLQLTAKDGIAISQAVSASTTTINADSDANGQGTFSLGASAGISTGGSDLRITSGDIDVQSAINAGSGTVTLLTTASRTMALGSAIAQYTLDGTELQRITARNLDFGGSTNGNITIDGVTAAQSAGISGLVWLQAIDHAQQITFSGEASAFRSLLAYAANGLFANTNITTTVGDLGLDGDFRDSIEGFDQIVFAPDVVLQAAGFLTLFFAQNGYLANGNLTLNAGSGMLIKDDLTVSGAVSINSDSDGDGTGTLMTLRTIRANGFPLSISAADVDLQGEGIIGGGSITMTATAGHTVGLGTAIGGFTLSGTELALIRAATLRIETTGSISVAGVTASETQGITSGVTLRATGAGSDVLFSGGANTFRALSGFAQDAITVNSSILTTNGELRLESGNSLVVNSPLATSGTTGGVVSIIGGVEVNASITARSFNITLITGAQLDLIIDTDRISATSLLLSAPRDIIVKATVQTTSSTADIQLIADSDHDGSGGVWIQETGQVLSGRNVVLEGSNLFATGGLGGALDSVRIDADGASSQVTAAGNITIRQSAFAPTGADTIIEGRVLATGSGTIDVSAKNVIQLATTLSTESGQIALHAPVVLTGNSRLASTTGGVTIDGVIDGVVSNTHSLTIDTAGAVLFSGAVGNSFSLAALDVASSGSLTALASINAGTATLHAANGISLAASLTVASPLEINADSDGNGTGTFALAPAASVTTGGNAISITAADVDLRGTLNSESAETELLATDCRTVGLGLATGDFTLSGAELQRITAGTLHVGGANAGTILVDGVSAAQSQQIGKVVLEAGCPLAELKFIGSGSFFQALEGTAQGAITVEAPLRTLVGDLRLDSAAKVTVNQAVTASGNGDIDLFATDAIQLASSLGSDLGDVTLHAPTLLTGNASIHTAGGNIVFTNAATIDSAFGQTHDLELNAGSGNVELGAAVGGARPVGNLTVVDSGSITAVDLAAGAMSLKARGSIDLNGNVSTTGPVTIVADSDANQTGDFTLAARMSLVTNDNALSITAADVHLLGTLSSGLAEMQFHASTAQAVIGAGDASADFSIDNAEIGRIVNTTGLVTIGDSGNLGGIRIAIDENLDVGGLTVSFVTGEGIEIGDFDLSSTTVLALTADADGNGTGAITAGRGLVSADTLVVAAAEGISLTTAARVLDARNSSTGDIEIHEIDDLDLRRVAQTGSGNIDIEAHGTLRVLSSEPGVSSGDGAIVLETLGRSARLVVDGLVTSLRGPIQLLSEGDVSFGKSGFVQSVSGDVLVVADNGAGDHGHGIVMADGALVDAGSGDVALRADGDIVVGRLRSTSASGAAIRVITTSGGIFDAGDTLGPDVSAPTALFSAVTGIGDRDPLDTSIGVLAATNAFLGNVRFNDVSGQEMIVGTVDSVSGITNSAGPGSVIELIHSGRLTIEQPVTALGGGDIRLGTVAGAVGADVFIAAPVVASGGDGTITITAFRDLVIVDTGATDDVHVAGRGTIAMFAGRDIRLGADVRVATEGEMIRLDAGVSTLDTAGAIVMDDQATIDAVKGPVRLLADADVIVGRIHTVTLVSITSNFGAIIDGHASAGPDVVVRDLAMRAARGIGIGDALEISVDNLAMENTKAGGIQVVNAAGHDLVIGDVDGLSGIRNSGEGAASVTSTGHMLVKSQILAEGGGDVRLTSLAGGDLIVDARIHVLKGGNLSLTSARDLLIHDTGDPADLMTEGEGRIDGVAGQFVVFAPNVIVQTGVGSISTLIPTLEQVAAPQITAGGVATVSGVFGDPGSHNFTLTVDWGDGTVDVFHFDNPGAFTATHFFESNPNTGNQAAPIGIQVTVADDPNSQFVGGLQPAFTVPLNATDSQTFAHGFSSVLVFTNAPGEGLGFFYVDTTLKVPPLLFPPPTVLVYLPDGSAPIAGNSSVDVESSVVLGEDAIQRRLVLLVPVDLSGNPAEPVELDENVLDDLPKLFRRLPDGRYRLLVKDVGEERPRLLIDVSLRGGKPSDDSESGSDKPPTGEIGGETTMTVDEEASAPTPGDADAGPMATPPVPAAKEDGSAGNAEPVRESALLSRPAAIAAAAFATAVVKRESWEERVDRALATSSPESFGKAARLARRLRRSFAAAGNR